MNPKRLKPWQDAYNADIQQKSDIIDYTAWLNGSYISLAIASMLDGHKYPYPEKPITIARREAEKAENQRIADEMAAANFMAWAMEFNKRFEVNNNGESTSIHA